MALSIRLDAPATPDEEVAIAMAIHGNSIGVISLVEAVLKASARLGIKDDKQIAGIFDISPQDFCKAFSANYPDRNKLMKVLLPMPIVRTLAVVLCEVSGLTVAGADVERQAMADVVEACAHYLRVCGR